MQGVNGMRTTAKGKSIYIHLFDWPASTCEIPGIDARIISVRLLANGKPLIFRQSENKLQIEVPQQAPDQNVECHCREDLLAVQRAKHGR